MNRIAFPIHHTFGPLVTRDQWRLAFRLQFQPWKWREGRTREQLRDALRGRFGGDCALFATGREGLLAALRAMEISPGEEVIVQGFTCVVVPNAIHAAGGVPVYAECDPGTLNLDMRLIQQVITHRTRAIICQHTFGIPADTERLRAICDKRGLALIEDCAHVIPDSPVGNIGKHGDLLFFSLGRDKAISGVSGGAVCARHSMIAERLRTFEEQAVPLGLWHTLNLLDYPIRYRFAKGLWRSPSVAKAYLRWIRLFGLLPPILSTEEKKGNASVQFHELPNVCAALALQQWQHLAMLNEHRRRLTRLYLSAAEEHGWNVPEGVRAAVALQKFPVYVENADDVRMRLKQEQVYLDDGWNGAVVNPRASDQEAAGYRAGTCPEAETVARCVLSFPTHPTMGEEEARYLIHAFQSLRS